MCFRLIQLICLIFSKKTKAPKLSKEEIESRVEAAGLDKVSKAGPLILELHRSQSIGYHCGQYHIPTPHASIVWTLLRTDIKIVTVLLPDRERCISHGVANNLWCLLWRVSSLSCLGSTVGRTGQGYTNKPPLHPQPCGQDQNMTEQDGGTPSVNRQTTANKTEKIKTLPPIMLRTSSCIIIIWLLDQFKLSTLRSV